MVALADIGDIADSNLYSLISVLHKAYCLLLKAYGVCVKLIAHLNAKKRKLTKT